jgi:hypothetical protein
MSVANTIRRALGLSTKIGFPLFDAQVGFEKAVFELLSDWDRVAAFILVSNIKHELATRGPTAQVILEIHQMNLAALRQLYGRTLPMRGVFDDDTWIERMAEVIKVGEEIEAALADLASRGAWS